MLPFIISRKLPIFGLGDVFQVLTAGFGSNYNTRCVFPLPIIPPSFSSLHSLEAEKRPTEFRDGFVYLGRKTVSRGPRSLGF